MELANRGLCVHMNRMNHLESSLLFLRGIHSHGNFNLPFRHSSSVTFTSKLRYDDVLIRVFITFSDSLV